MSEAKDPAIKLFGKTILFPEISPRAAPVNYIDTTSAQKGSPCCSSNRVDGDSGLDQDRPSCASSFQEESDVITRRVEDGESSGKYTEEVKTIESRQGSQRKKEINDSANQAESATPDAASGVGENSEAPSTEKGSTTSQASNSGEQQNEANTSEEKTLKKPDKIIPCPRCKSMDTKFCYYNNYNVSQPRHFCKNCQRYWTAGGTMRNVPVGAGRRKNKTSSSQYRHMTIPEALQNVRTDIPNGVHPSFKVNGTVLTFGSEIPLHESMASVLNIAEKSLRNGTRNGFHTLDPLALPVSSEGGKNGNDHSIRSAAAETGTNDEASKIGSQDSVMQNLHSFPPQVPCYPGAPWPYPWTSAPWSSPMPLPGFCPPGFAMPIFPPAAYWGCSVPGPWSVPWLAQPPSPKPTAGSSGPNSPTLGKHSRDENMLKLGVCGDDEPMKETTTERCLWIPKTLRIDDPEEAAKSSIWTTLGIRNDKSDSIGGRGLFKAFEQKGDERNHAAETTSVLQANPAALSRSVKFHESS